MELDKEVLCIVPSVDPNNAGSYFIYTDKTFRHSSWHPGDVSKWKLVKGPAGHYEFHYKHPEDREWCFDGDSDPDDKPIIEAILLEREMRKLFEKKSEDKS